MTPGPAVALPDEPEGGCVLHDPGPRAALGHRHLVHRSHPPEDSAAPPPLPLAGSFSPFDDGLMGRWMLIINTPAGERSLLVSRLVELEMRISSTQPLPPSAVRRPRSATMAKRGPRSPTSLSPAPPITRCSSS